SWQSTIIRRAVAKSIIATPSGDIAGPARLCGIVAEKARFLRRRRHSTGAARIRPRRRRDLVVPLPIPSVIAMAAAGGSPHTPQAGHVAEWLRSGLQNRLRRFNSGRGLHPLPVSFTGVSGSQPLEQFSYRTTGSIRHFVLCNNVLLLCGKSCFCNCYTRIYVG